MDTFQQIDIERSNALSNTVDARNPTPPKKPRNDDSLVNTHKPWFPPWFPSRAKWISKPSTVSLFGALRRRSVESEKNVPRHVSMLPCGSHQEPPVALSKPRVDANTR